MTARTTGQAMGTDTEAAELRARAERLGREHCTACHRPLPHTAPELRACPGGDE
jgi:mono/diheme cytochrome c family protein